MMWHRKQILWHRKQILWHINYLMWHRCGTTTRERD
jgi:hypothetical protein